MRALSVVGGEKPAAEAETIASVPIGGVPVTFALVRGPDPDFQADSEENERRVLVQVTAFSLNFRDKAVILRASRDLPPGADFPIGSEFAAVVLACGTRVTRCSPGESVLINGSYPNSGVPGVPGGLPTNSASCERLIVHESRLVRAPAAMSDVQAAAFTIGGQTSFAMLRRSRLDAGETLLVTAANSNTSLSVISAVRGRGIPIYATTTSARHRARIEAFGAKLVEVSPELETFGRHPELRAIADGCGGFDVAIDPFSDVHVGKVLDVLSGGGRYVTCGVYNQYTGITGEAWSYRGIGGVEFLSTLMMKNVSIIGSCLGLEKDLTLALAEFEAGRFAVPIDTVFEGRDIGPFLDRSYNDPQRLGKVVFRWR